MTKWTTRIERERAWQRMIERSAVGGVGADWHAKDVEILRDCLPVQRADYEELLRIREQSLQRLYPEQSSTAKFKQECVGEFENEPSEE
jgi:hypothetical protein